MAGPGACYTDADLEAKKKDSIYHQVNEFLAKGETVAVATIVSTKGSTPREVGAKMVVTAWGEILGTIGGGCGEADVKREAIEVIRSRKPRTVRVDLLDDISSDSPGGVRRHHECLYRSLVAGARPGGGKRQMSSLSEELVKIAEQGEAAVLVTVVEVQGDGRIQPGAKCLIRDGKAQVETIGDAKVVAALVRESDSPCAGGKVATGFAGDSRQHDQARSVLRSHAVAAQADRRRRRSYRRAAGEDRQGARFSRHRDR